jgi:hypothetical protein
MIPVCKGPDEVPDGTIGGAKSDCQTAAKFASSVNEVMVYNARGPAEGNFGGP